MTESRVTESVSNSDGGSRGGIGLLVPGGTLGQRWEILEVLGRGGFSVVYLARDRELGREVAVKVLREDRLNPVSLRRFQREAGLARDLSHPRLVRIFDIEQVEGAIFLTQEAVRGGSLRDLIRDGPLPVERTVEIARQLFEALAALHAVGIVHRDVKPANVLLTESGDLKLGDFGLALDLERDETRLTASEATVGTLEYLSPEQAMAEPVDPRSDLYSAGIVLYEMLTGRLPHGGRSSLGSLVARFREKTTPVRSVRADVPAWLGRIVDRLIERRPDDRYATADEVLRDLGRRRARLTATRRRIRVAVAAFALLVVAAGIVASVREIRGRRFSHVVLENNGRSVSAIDRRGRTLWRKDEVRAYPNFVPFRLAAGGPVRIAASLASISEFAIEKTRELSILDPQTGEEVDRMTLADASGEFHGFAPHFGANLAAVDLDHDGADELVVDFIHNPYWPSFSVLVEPRLRRSRVLLVASGHHWFKAAEDLNGDGRQELLFAGINNRMGWHQGVAAVKVPVGLGDPSVLLATWAPAMTADRLARSFSALNLAWYALAPRGLMASLREGLSTDRARREIRIDYSRREPYLLDFDGLPIVGGETRPAAMEERQEVRLKAYLAMTEGMRLEEAYELSGAVSAFDEAYRWAAEARLPILELWLRQCRNRARAAIAPWPEVEAEMRAILAVSDHPAEVAFDTARALHRAGRLEEALSAYRESFAQRGATDGRSEYELIEGTLLALVELGRLDDAEAEVFRYCSSTATEFNVCAHFRQYVRWMSGRPIALAEVPPVIPQNPDLQRYWGYELRLAAGVPAEELLRQVEAEAASVSAAGPLFESLTAELLGRLGRLEEAARRASAAREQLEPAMRREFQLRAHATLVRERATRWPAALAAKGPAFETGPPV